MSSHVWSRVGYRVWLIGLLLTLFLLAAAVATRAQAEQPSPQQVEVGVWFNGIHTIDFIDGSFGAEFYLWWISANPDFEPFKVMQVLNGRDWSARAVDRRVLPDGRYYTSGMVSVTVNHDWDLHNYPFDRHRLSVVIETPYNADELRLVPDQRDSVVSRFLDVKGFKVTGMQLHEQVAEYETDFGLQRNAGKKFSRLILDVDLKRERSRLVVAILIGFIVANLISLFTYLIHVTMLGVRATMVASAIFGAVGNTYMVNSLVHPAVGSLLLDRIALGSFTAVIIALLNGIVVDRLAIHNRINLARKVNWSVFVVVILVSCLYYSLTFHAAISAAN
jgi:hypothetical protein